MYLCVLVGELDSGYKRRRAFSGKTASFMCPNSGTERAFVRRVFQRPVHSQLFLHHCVSYTQITCMSVFHYVSKQKHISVYVCVSEGLVQMSLSVCGSALASRLSKWEKFCQETYVSIIFRYVIIWFDFKSARCDVITKLPVFVICNFIVCHFTDALFVGNLPVLCFFVCFFLRCRSC